MLRKCICLSAAAWFLSVWAVEGQTLVPLKNEPPTQLNDGRLIRIDAERKVVVIRGTEFNAREREYGVDKGTKYYGANNQLLNDGIGNQGWREGAAVRYLPGTDNSLRELRLRTVTIPAPTAPPPGK